MTPEIHARCAAGLLVVDACTRAADAWAAGDVDRAHRWAELAWRLTGDRDFVDTGTRP